MGTLRPRRYQRYDIVLDTISSYKVEAVLHFAASAYVGESVTDPQKYYENNVGGSLSLLPPCWKPAAASLSSPAPARSMANQQKSPLARRRRKIR